LRIQLSARWGKEGWECRMRRAQVAPGREGLGGPKVHDSLYLTMSSAMAWNSARVHTGLAHPGNWANNKEREKK
jgi:hypothetical protein